MELNATARLDLALGQLLRENESLKDLCASQHQRVADLTEEVGHLKKRLADALERSEGRADGAEGESGAPAG